MNAPDSHPRDLLTSALESEPEGLPISQTGWVTCHYIDPQGALQRSTIISTVTMERISERQADIRAALVTVFGSLGCDVVSVQMALAGSCAFRAALDDLGNSNSNGTTPGLPSPQDTCCGSPPAQVLHFPVRRASSID